MKKRLLPLLPVVFGLVLAVPALAQTEEAFTDEFEVDECTFSDRGRNPYFSLEPGDQLVLEGEEDGETTLLKVTVLNHQKWIVFSNEDDETLMVRTRVVEEREWKNGELIEVSRNYYARCKETNDVYYFGEDVDFYDGGVIVNHAGSWRAGFDGARPGVIMPGSFLLGSRYYQEIAPGIALDRAEHTRMGFEMDVPAGDFDDCVEILETTPLEPDSEGTKIYCAEVGLVADGENELVRRRHVRGPRGPRD